jgi:NAD(P)-dependent dehydrogenase (short-subunit alcohol dehydrogenase family)
MMGQLQGKTAVVLGAASEGNMGQTIARLFAKEGAKVMVAGRKEAPLAALASEIGGEYALCDITSRAEVNAMADKAQWYLRPGRYRDQHHRLGPARQPEEITEEQLDQIVDLQFKGVHHFLQAFVRVMSQQQPTGGSLISLSSATTKAIITNHAAYIGTKRGSEALIECVANDYGHLGIKANTVSPAFTDSPMTHDSFQVPGLTDAFLPRYPMGRLNTVDDVAMPACGCAPIPPMSPAPISSPTGA